MTNATDTKNKNANEPKQSWSLSFLDDLLFGGGTLVLIFIAILVIAILVATLGVDGNGQYSVQQTDKEKTDSLFLILFIVVLIILALVGGIQYLFKTDIYTSVKKDGDINEIDIVFDHKTDQDEAEPEDVPKPQVFNIPGNYYNYDKAKNLCKAYGAELATYGQIEQAYENGGEWCNYGWSAGQLALFPTQQATFDKLQKIPGHEQDCGRPGINGGFMANPQIEYGVNCFGMKPDITDEERFLMENRPLYQKTKKDKKDEKQVDNLKKQLKDILVSPFNSKTWSRY